MIDKKEILTRVGLINPPDSAYTNDRINLQLVVPRHVMKAMEEKITKILVNSFKFSEVEPKMGEVADP